MSEDNGKPKYGGGNDAPGAEEKPDDERANSPSEGGTKRPITAETGWPRSLRDGADRLGMAVFLISAMGVIVFIFMINIFPLIQGNASDYRLLRSIDSILTISALGLIVVFMSRSTSPFVVAFAIFLIGALIVPAKDIVRFALIASGSQQKLEDFFGSGSVGPDTQGRSSDAASKIVTEVLNFDGYIDGKRPELIEADRILLIKNISRKIYEERVITILERVKSQGALELLISASSRNGEGFSDFIYKHATHEKFVDDVRFLRSEDLISFAYDDLSSLRQTQLGGDVLNFYETGVLPPFGSPTSGGSSVNLTEGLSVADVYGVGSVECREVLELDAVETILVELDSGKTTPRKFEVGPPNWVKLTLDAGTFVFNATADDSSQIDPFMALFSVENSSCTEIENNDDGGDSLNARISGPLKTGEYLVGVTSIGSIGEITLTIERQ